MSEKILNILLVEDDVVDVMNVQRAFKKQNITSSLCVASNGIEALEILRAPKGSPQAMSKERRLVLLDLNMPRMNGLEFLVELRGDSALKSTPVIVLTTSDEDRDRVEAYNFNVAGYILKPVTFSNFSDVVMTLNKYWALCEMP
jgi:CheY-like chemotaxis protein